MYLLLKYLSIFFNPGSSLLYNLLCVNALLYYLSTRLSCLFCNGSLTPSRQQRAICASLHEVWCNVLFHWMLQLEVRLQFTIVILLRNILSVVCLILYIYIFFPLTECLEVLVSVTDMLNKHSSRLIFRGNNSFHIPSLMLQ